MRELPFGGSLDQKGAVGLSAKGTSRKTLLRAFLILFIILAVLGVLLGILALVDHLLGKNSSSAVSGLDEPDYSVNILEEEAYLKLNRAVYYLEYGSGEELNESNFDTVGVASGFFYRYFDAVIRGDADVYRSMLTDDYIDKNDVPERFTMQRLYDIRVDQCQGVEYSTYHGVEARVYYFEVSYKINRNDGTFRSDIGSNRAVTQYYELYRVGDRFMLNAVSNKKVKTA